MKRLSVEDDAGNVRVVTLQPGVLTIGRAPDNDLVLDERNVSRHHARIRYEDDRCLIEDAGSRYGIRWSQGRVEGAVEIRPGEVFQIGDFRLKVLPEDDALEETPEEEVTPLVTPVLSRDDAAKREGEPIGGDTMRKIRELEEFAKQGWASDFNPDEPSERRQAGRSLLALVVLILLAAGLLLAYFHLSEEEPVLGVVPTTSSPPRPEPSVRDEPVGSPKVQELQPKEPSAPPADAPGGEASGRAGGDRTKALDPGLDASPPPQERTTAAKPSSGSRPAGTAAPSKRTETKPAPSASPPSPPTPVASVSETDAYTRAKQRGDQCKSLGDTKCAIEAYREALRLTHDQTTRERLERAIRSLEGRTE